MLQGSVLFQIREAQDDTGHYSILFIYQSDLLNNFPLYSSSVLVFRTCKAVSLSALKIYLVIFFFMYLCPVKNALPIKYKALVFDLRYIRLPPSQRKP